MGPLSFARLVRPYWLQLTAAFAAMLLASVAELLEPWPLKIIFDYVIASKRLPAWLAAWPSLTSSRTTLLDAAAIAVVAIALLSAIEHFAQKYLATTVAQRVMHDLRHLLYHHVQRLSLSFFARRQTGDMVVRLTSDIDAAQDFISSIFLGMVFDVVTLVGMLVAMVYLDWRFTLIALSIAPVLFAVDLPDDQADQESGAGGQAQGERARVGGTGIDFVDSRRQSFRPGRVRRAPAR